MKQQTLSGVYMYSFSISERKYIGSSIDLKNRNSCHISALKTNTHYNTSFLEDFKKYGIDKLQYLILELVDNSNYINRILSKTQFQEIVFEREQSYLDLYYAQEYLQDLTDTRFFKLLYNKSVLARFAKSELSTIKEKEVHKFTKDGKYLDSFFNSEIAGICCHIDSASIKKVCYKQRLSAGGYIWSYDRNSCNKYINLVFKRINQYTINKEFITSFSSIEEAKRFTGIDIRKEKNSAALMHGGFYWLFDGEDFPKRKRCNYDILSIEKECNNYILSSHKYRDRLVFCRYIITKYNVKLSTIQNILQKYMDKGNIVPSDTTRLRIEKVKERFDL